MTRHYIFIRRDLPIGVALAQTAHAAGESACEFTRSHSWVPTLPPHTTVVVLEAADEYVLFRVQKLLQAHDIPHKSIVECDDPYSQQLMAIGLVPTDDDAVVKLMKPFRLLTTLDKEV